MTVDICQCHFQLKAVNYVLIKLQLNDRKAQSTVFGNKTEICDWFSLPEPDFLNNVCRKENVSLTDLEGIPALNRDTRNSLSVSQVLVSSSTPRERSYFSPSLYLHTQSPSEVATCVGACVCILVCFSCLQGQKKKKQQKNEGFRSKLSK